MRAIVTLAAGLALASCGDGSAPLVGEVTKAEFEAAGLRWPLTVERGRLGCNGMEYYFLAEDGKRYGLNGLATEKAGYAAIEPIWAIDEKSMSEFRKAGGGEEPPVLRINIGDMIKEAGKTCS